jgi:outer membrane protein OmpA-like peptidoglycan-associated protein
MIFDELQRRPLNWLAGLLFSMALAPALAKQDPADVQGSRDHPLLTRYPNSHITEYTKNYDAIEFTVGGGARGSSPRKEKVEGEATRLQYFHSKAEGQPSPLQVVRNYQGAMKAIGGEVLWERIDGATAESTLRVTTGGKEYWVQVAADVFSAPTQSYRLVIVERAAMAQVVSANKMLEELNAKGFVTLYINFDTNKWDLKAEAQPTIAEIARLMKAQPAIRLSVEGHTDNVGLASANKTLSENRARSVMNAIVGQGIAAARLASKGFGQENPIADNRTEEGRAKNRRVELVKK